MSKKLLLQIFFCCCMITAYGQGYGKIHYNAFSHNDYARKRPLFDALSYHFNCVEADLWLIDGELYVSHDKPEPKPSITFRNLYLKPLFERIRENKGKVYPESDRPFLLMIDCKSNGEEMLPLLQKQLKKYKKHLCSVKNGKYHEGEVMVFISGDHPRSSIINAKKRFLFLDGTLDDVGKGYPTHLFPVVSDNFRAFFKTGKDEDMSAEDLQKMRKFIKSVHAEGKLFRWWGAPDNERYKRLFIKEGIDLIGADNLELLFDILK